MTLKTEIYWIVILMIVMCTMLAGLICIRFFVEQAEVKSMQYGYCLLADEGIWQRIQTLKTICY